ncbi:MAG: hypothetical protein AUJ28_00670 [Parcubacteria group bacterium CG1_02_37_51]|uniref:Uncharacterized protein n=2 Tax=Candidatus Komeiliibacteriota TaxID=1817908 RepID=A0A2M8DSD4_9BACT|nr:MAG: hypothetical protein AUJ28_00670 [Parcubacteria group bacterium CG1_02_37_51]PIY95397.1 MAG: hypothetical protein COY67_00165 [Candidatus Komeilibacteria bacterium CG_4_10_14_0_8_um_filter_37_78]PJC02259.1 MAG: hypothetical protein CO073_00410 [Candidatus Komeilibacteria bacterium CG_4_9_14_0_8_um_filter_36_9]
MDDQPEQFSGLNDKQLKYAYWFILRKKQFKKIGIITFIVFDVLMLVIAIWGLISYLSNYQEFNQLTQEAPAYIDWQTYHQTHQPVAIQAGIVNMVAVADNKYDLGAKITNNNEDWGVAHLTYQFLLAGGDTTVVQDTFLLPNSEKYLLAFGVVTTGRSASLQILKIDWVRIKPSDAWSEVDIRTDNVTYHSGRELDDRNAVGGWVEWQAINRSLDSFWDVGWQVIALSGTKEVGYNYLQTNSLNSWEEQDLSVNWLHSISRVTDVIIIPEINIFDPAVIKK